MRRWRAATLVVFLLVATATAAGAQLAPTAAIRIKANVVGGPLGGTWSLSTNAVSVPGANSGGSQFTQYRVTQITSESDCQSLGIADGVGHGVTAGPITAVRGVNPLQGDDEWLVIEVLDNPVSIGVHLMTAEEGEAFCLALGNGDYNTEILGRARVIITG